MENRIEVQNLCVSYGHKKIFENFSFAIPKGQFVAISGSNGSGKSTLMKAILGIIPYKGTIRLNAQQIGYLPQSFAVDRSFPITVKEFLEIALPLGKQSFDITKVLILVNLQNQQNLFLNELSQGQFQRLLFARSLLNHPDLLILDEPLSNIDEETALNLKNSLLELNKNGVTILMSIHDSKFIAENCHQVLAVGKIPTGIMDPCFHNHQGDT